MADISREEADRLYAERDALYQLAKSSQCSVCLRQMDVRTVAGELRMLCPADPAHEGYRQRRSLTQMVRDGDAIDPFVSARIEGRRQKAMDEKMAGDPETRALVTYGGEGPHLMTTEAATRIIRHLWPKASPAAIEHALLICVQNNLNPLLKHLYIIRYGEADTVVLGIEGNRVLARRKTPYDYADGPRPLLAEDVVAMGEDPKVKIGVTVTLRTPGGGRFPGFGFIGRPDRIMGTEKGNTHFKMASFRAEREALKRVMPDAELPAPVGNIIDGVFVDVTEIIEAPKIAAPRSERPQARPQPAQAEVARLPQAPQTAQEGAGGKASPAYGVKLGQAEANATQALKAKSGLTDLQLANRINLKFPGRSFANLTLAEREEVREMLREVVAAHEEAVVEDMGEEGQ